MRGGRRLQRNGLPGVAARSKECALAMAAIKILRTKKEAVVVEVDLITTSVVEDGA